MRQREQKEKRVAGLKVLRPGDEGFQKISGGGRPDVVSPALDPLLDEILDSPDGLGEFQIPDGEPFNVAQVRNWQNKQAVRLHELGKHLQIGGGGGRNISVAVIPFDQRRPNNARRGAPEPVVTNGSATRKRPATKPTATRKPRKRAEKVPVKA